jgi:hypothetical protein
MIDLRARLQDTSEAGVYRLNCPLAGVRAATAQMGFLIFEAELTLVHDKRSFLATVAKALNAPEGFCNNWDALADALGDLSWQPAPGYVLLLRNGGESIGLPAAELVIANEIFIATVNFWKSKRIPFWVFRC